MIFIEYDGMLLIHFKNKIDAPSCPITGTSGLLLEYSGVATGRGRRWGGGDMNIRRSNGKKRGKERKRKRYGGDEDKVKIKIV